MNVLAMLSALRLKSGDYRTPDQELVGLLRGADAQAFHLVREKSPDELRAALMSVFESAISVARPYVVLGGQIWTDLVAEVADEHGNLKQCATFDLASESSVAVGWTWRPAAIVQRGRVKFYPSDSFTTGTRKVRLAYIREPRPILYLAGLTGAITSSAYGTALRSGLDRIEFTTSADSPAVVENELQGAILSVFVSETLRRDYTIEEHEAGPLAKVYVSPNYTSEEWIDAPFVPAPEGRYRMAIHRTSDLPEHFHQMIVELAVSQPAEAQ